LIKAAIDEEENKKEASRLFKAYGYYWLQVAGRAGNNALKEFESLRVVQGFEEP
jgi:hypothetical protein